MSTTADVVVIGAGVIGCSVAYQFAREGRKTIVIDRAKGPGMGSTSASSAIIRFHYSTYTGVAASWEAKHCWEAWEEHLGGTDDGSLARFHRTGGLILDYPDLDVWGTCARYDEVGVPYERWTAAQIRDRFPGIDPARHFPPKPVASAAFWDEPDGELGATWTPDAGFIDDPAFAAHNLMVAARRHGAEFRFGESLTSIGSRGGRVTEVITGAGGIISCDVLVNVAGPHSGVINRLAGVADEFKIRTRPMRQEVHELPASGAVYPMVADTDLGTYFRPTPVGNLLVGGAEPECDPLPWVDDPDNVGINPTLEAYEAQTLRVARRLPGLSIPPAPKGIVGVYDVSTDWVPIYDRTSLGGYYVAIGTSGNQFKNAPVVGGFLHSIVSATESGVDHDRQPVQHVLPRTNLTISLGDYSRLREPTKTAGNVMG